MSAQVGQAMALVLVLAGCTSSVSQSDQPTPDQSMSKGVSVSSELATSRLAEAELLVQQVVDAVEPGTQITDLLPGRQPAPQPCTGADSGLVYYRLDRQFAAPAGRTGGSLIPALAAELARRGFAVHDPGDTVGWPTRTAATEYLAVSLLGAPDAPTVRVGVDSRCGRPG